MARIATDPNYSSPTFPRATAGTDLFLKEDVQALAAAVSTHVHDGAGKGLQLVSIPASAIADGLITSAKIADGTIVAGDIADNAITPSKILDGAITSAKIADGTISTVDMAEQAATRVYQAVGGSANPSTTSATMVDIPELTLTFTPVLGGAATIPTLILVTGTFYCSVLGALATFAINVDGSDVWNATAGGHVAGVGGIFTVTLSYSTPLNSSAHTIKARWSISTGTLTANQAQRALDVVEIRR